MTVFNSVFRGERSSVQAINRGDQLMDVTPARLDPVHVQSADQVAGCLRSGRAAGKARVLPERTEAITNDATLPPR